MRTLVIAILAIAVIVVGAITLQNPRANIILAAEPVFSVGGFSVTNTMTAAWLTIITWAVVAWLGTRKMQLIPSGWQNFLEAVVDFLYTNSIAVAGERHGRRFFPFAAAVFLFIITSNWFGLVPGFTTLGVAHPHHEGGEETLAPFNMQPVQVGPFSFAYVPFFAPKYVPPAEGEHATGETAEHAAAENEGGLEPFEFIPIFRSAATDLNVAIGLGLLSFLMVEYWGMSTLGGFKYLGRFFVNPFKDPIGSMLGIIEIVTEFARIISWGFRLFGNIFAGEVLLGVIGFLSPLLLLLPFYGLELFVGFIQAIVFAMLVLVFGSIAVEDHSESHHEAEAHH